MAKNNMKQFCKDRDEALLSLNREKIIAYLNKYNVPVPNDELVFWAGVHKGIVSLSSAPIKARERSAEWLIHHGFFPGIK